MLFRVNPFTGYALIGRDVPLVIVPFVIPPALALPSILVVSNAVLATIISGLCLLKPPPDEIMSYL
jgi:hypothetical protein